MKVYKWFIIIGVIGILFLGYTKLSAIGEVPKKVTWDEWALITNQRIDKIEERLAKLEQVMQPVKPNIPKSQTYLGQIYIGLGSGHWVSKKIDSGKYIKLEDGSLWEISSIDKIYTMLWLTTENITVVESKNPLYPYNLINTDSKDAAEAKLISK